MGNDGKNIVKDLKFERAMQKWRVKRPTDLTPLDLHSNQITDISLLTGLTTRTTLRLRHNKITRVQTVRGRGSVDIILHSMGV